MSRASLVKRLCAVAAAAGVVFCVLEGLPDAADGGDPTAGPPPEAEGAPAPAPSVNPDAAAGILSRRHNRRFKRAGGPTPDAGWQPARDGGASRDASHDVIARGGIYPPRNFVPPVAPPPPPPPPAPTGPSTSQPITDLGFNTCQKIPRGKRIVKANLKPDIELPELVAWISSVTCKSFVLPGHLAGGKKITFVTQNAMTRDEAYAAFLSALDSLGLTVENHPGYLKIIETSKAKSASLPVYGFDGKQTRAKPAASGD